MFFNNQDVYFGMEDIFQLTLSENSEIYIFCLPSGTKNDKSASNKIIQRPEITPNMGIQ